MTVRADLRPLEDHHVPVLHHMFLDDNNSRFWRTRGLRLSLDEFAHLVRERSSHSFVGVDPVTAHPVVLCSVFGEDLMSGVAYLSIGGDTAHPRSLPLIGSAVEQYLSYLFNGVGFRKLCFELPASQVSRLSGSLNRWRELASNEGVLRSHVRFGNRIEDLYVYGILAEDWQAMSQPLVGSHGHLGRRGFELGTRDDPLAVVRLALTSVTHEALPEELDGGLDLVRDLGLDSLLVAELLVVIEDLSGVAASCVSPEVRIDTVQDLVSMIEGATW